MRQGRETFESVGALARRLADPRAFEDIDVASTQLVVCRVGGDPDLDETEREALGSALTSLGAVTVAIADGPVPTNAESLMERFDVVMEPTRSPSAPHGSALVTVPDLDAALDDLERAVRDQPDAALALARLLRLRVQADVARGLIAESATYSMLLAGPGFGRWQGDRSARTVPPDPEPPVLIERSETALSITLNRPHRANAITAAMRDQLVEAFQLAIMDTRIEGVILRGAGESFSAGGDLDEFGTTPDPVTANGIRLARSPAWLIHRYSRDTRVYLHGACIGAGIELPAFAGTVIAAPDSVIRLPEVSMGLIPGAGGTVSLCRRIGPWRTAFIAITGQACLAEDALAWGMVDRIGHDPAST